MFKAKLETDSSDPVSEDELDDDEIDNIESSGMFRKFEKDGKTYWIDDVKIKRPSSSFSSEAKNGKIVEIPVMSLPLPRKIGTYDGKEVIDYKSGFTVTDIDSGPLPKRPPFTLGVVRTDRGWQIIQSGLRDELEGYNDKEYIRISKERGHYNQRSKSRDGSKSRLLTVRTADLLKEEVRQMVQAWKDAGGIVRAFRGFWSSFKLGKGKLI